MLIKRIYRQHTATVLALPRPALDALEAKAGDYLVLDIDDVNHEVTLAKVPERKFRDGESLQNRNQQDKGGQA